MTREELRKGCLERLDKHALEHPAGHQGKLAARYLLRCSNGDVAELMFEKGPNSVTNLWVAERRVSQLLEKPELQFRYAPASALFVSKDKDGKPKYGRHSALKPMNELAFEDLVCFRISTLGELDRILDYLAD
jgi:hypothetical protein